MKIVSPFLLFTSLIISSVACAAQSSDIQTIKKSLKPWQPMEVTNTDGNISVALNAAQVTPEIYNAVVMAGVCPTIWTKDAPESYMKNVKELQILNKFKAMGYVLEKPLATCNEMGKETDDRAKTIMLSQTHLY